MSRFDARKKYPWELWQNGEEHVTADPPDEKQFVRTLHMRAHRTNSYVLTKTVYDTNTRVFFQFFDTAEQYQAAKHKRSRSTDGQFKANSHNGVDLERAARKELGFCFACGKRLLARPETEATNLCHGKNEAGEFVQLCRLPKHTEET